MCKVCIYSSQMVLAFGFGLQNDNDCLDLFVSDMWVYTCILEGTCKTYIYLCDVWFQFWCWFLQCKNPFFQGSPGGNIGASFSQFSASSGLHSPNLSGYSPDVSGFTPQIAGHGPNLSGHALNLSGYSSNLSGYSSTNLSGYSPNLSGYSPHMTGYSPNMSTFSPGTVYTPSPNVSGFTPAHMSRYSPNLSGLQSGSPGMSGIADSSGLRSRHSLTQTMKNAAGEN